MELNLPGGDKAAKAAAGDPKAAAEKAQKDAKKQAEKAQKEAKKKAEAAKKKAIKQAEARKKAAMNRLKRRLMMLAMLMMVAAMIALVVYFKDVKALFITMPEDVVEDAATDALKGDIEAFKEHFTDETIEQLELAWAETPRSYLDPRPGGWEDIAHGLLTEGKRMPEVQGQELDEAEENATVTVLIDGFTRTIEVVKVDDEWKLHIPLTIENSFRLPVPEGTEDELPPEVIAAVEEANPIPLDLWWEGREPPEKEKDTKVGAAKKFWRRMTSCSVAPSQAPAAPPGVPAALALLLGVWLLRRKR